jgi:hypothetical protein
VEAAVAGAAAAVESRDRFGIGWRPRLAAGILPHLDRIDLIEVIAEDYFDAPRGDLRALQTLAAQVRIVLHGVSLGLASTVPVEPRRLDRIARLIDATGAESWSEHLAFVRGGGIEIGHLAAPPRNEALVEGACRNLERAAQIVGCAPQVENIATLVVPPRAGWTRQTGSRGSSAEPASGYCSTFIIFMPTRSISATIRIRSFAGCLSSESRSCTSVGADGLTGQTEPVVCSTTTCTIYPRRYSRSCPNSAASPRSR